MARTKKKTYIVQTKEVHAREITIKASSEDEAKKLVLKMDRGGKIKRDTSNIYLHTLASLVWDVRVKGKKKS